MTRRVVHYEVEVGYDCLYQPACENAAGRDAIADIGREVDARYFRLQAIVHWSCIAIAAATAVYFLAEFAR